MSAAPDIDAKYLGCYEDPRTTPEFPGDAYPAEGASEASVPENVREAKARFKAVYARRNVCVRALSRLQPGNPDRVRLAGQITFLTEAIDHLEDVYAPIGLIAEAVMDDAMFTSELIFTHAQLAGARGEPFESSFSIYIPIPLDEPEDEEGPHGS